MKEINKLFFIYFFGFLVFVTGVDSKILTIGSTKAKVTVKVFSSLTCPHCANFHNAIFNNLKKEYIDKGLVKFEHHAFPLDLAALNAEIIVRCQANNDKKFELLEEIYNKQKVWAVGSDINKINAQDEILEQRIDAQKKYRIESTPTVIVNDKKYNNKVDYKSFKKIIEKNL